MGGKVSGKVGVQILSCLRYDKLPGILKSLYLPLHSEHGSQRKDMAELVARSELFHDTQRAGFYAQPRQPFSLFFPIIVTF